MQTETKEPPCACHRSDFVKLMEHKQVGKCACAQCQDNLSYYQLEQETEKAETFRATRRKEMQQRFLYEVIDHNREVAVKMCKSGAFKEEFLRTSLTVSNFGSVNVQTIYLFSADNICACLDHQKCHPKFVAACISHFLKNTHTSSAVCHVMIHMLFMEHAMHFKSEILLLAKWMTEQPTAYPRYLIMTSLLKNPHIHSEVVSELYKIFNLNQ